MVSEDEVVSPFQFLEISKKTNQYSQITQTMIEKSFALFPRFLAKRFMGMESFFPGKCVGKKTSGEEGKRDWKNKKNGSRRRRRTKRNGSSGLRMENGPNGGESFEQKNK